MFAMQPYLGMLRQCIVSCTGHKSPGLHLSSLQHRVVGNVLHYSTVKYTAVQYSTLEYRIALYSSALSCTYPPLSTECPRFAPDHTSWLLHSVHWTLHTTHYTLNTPQYTMNSVHSTPHNGIPTVNKHCTLFIAVATHNCFVALCCDAPKSKQKL